MALLANRVMGDSQAARCTMILHGVLGRKNNWGSVARALLKAAPEQQIVLPDLRLHGESQGIAGPHTIESAAQDVVQLAQQIGIVTRIIGHSLGSKVATVAAFELQAQTNLESLWLIDGTPSVESNGWERSSGAKVVSTLRRLGQEFASRESFLKQLQDAGFSKAVAIWLAMNLQSTVHGKARFSLDLDAIEELLRDYFRVDNWNRLQTMEGVERHLVVGAASDVVSADDQRRFSEFGQVHTIENAGHWVHVDQPKALLRLLST